MGLYERIIINSGQRKKDNNLVGIIEYLLKMGVCRMNDSIKGIETSFYKYMNKMTAFSEALSLAYWDMRTGAPKKGLDSRADTIGVLSSEIYKMSTSSEMENFIQELSGNKDVLSEKTLRALEECEKEFNRNRKIPPEQYKEYVILQSKAESIWEDAKAQSDFKMFQPYLEKVIEFNKHFIDAWGFEGNKYNTMLDLFEPGVTTDILDEAFKELRDAIVPIVQEIKELPEKEDNSFLFHHFPKEKQREFSIAILKQMGYDLEAGRLDETVHPFAIGLSPYDVRITTKYDEHDFRTAVFGTIHEGGHALYEQNISSDLIGTVLCDGASMGIHESQSLFWENFVGRDYSFLEKNYPLLKNCSEGQFDYITVESFYKAVNESKPSLIRIEADELTYPLHIMIRYEIEKGLFNDEVKVNELPEIWNMKMNEYLGITPKNDAEGVLQDVHWAGGSFGYFPSYALGYMYAAQIKASMEKEINNFQDLLGSGTLLPIKKWLSKNIHQYGKLKKPLDILKDVTGEELNSGYLIQYLRRKYSTIYDLS